MGTVHLVPLPLPCRLLLPRLPSGWQVMDSYHGCSLTSPTTSIPTTPLPLQPPLEVPTGEGLQDLIGATREKE